MLALVVEAVMGTVRELKRERVSILLVEQNAEMALGLADRVYVIDHGTIVFEGPGGAPSRRASHRDVSWSWALSPSATPLGVSPGGR